MRGPTGQKHLNSHEDVAYLTIYFGDSIIAHINVNLALRRESENHLAWRRENMLMWNDPEADEKVKKYDRGGDITSGEGVYDLLVSYRSGDMWAPRIEQAEAAEAKYFIDCIESNTVPSNDGAAGLRAVKLLEAADPSLRERGRAVQV